MLTAYAGKKIISLYFDTFKSLVRLSWIFPLVRAFGHNFLAVVVNTKVTP